MEVESLLFSEDDEEKPNNKKKDPGFDVKEKIKELMKTTSPVYQTTSQKLVHKSFSGNNGINKGVRHNVKRPKFKKKMKILAKSKRTGVKVRDVKIPQRLPSNRSPLKKGSKGKWHRLSSPGTSLLDTPDSSQEESPSQTRKFFTSRSKAAAIVKISKTIQLSSKNGEIAINQKPSAFEKKNIGRIIESELEKKIAATTLNSPLNFKRLENAGQLSSVANCITPPKPTRFPSSPSPRKRNMPLTPKGTPKRKTPRKQLLKTVSNASSPSRSPRFSPYTKKSTPKGKLVSTVSNTPKSSQKNLSEVENRRISPRKKKSLLKSLENSSKEERRGFENGSVAVDDIEDLEDFDSAFKSIKNQSEEDEILANILKENQSPEKESTFVRRSPRKHMSSVENVSQDTNKKTSKLSSPSKPVKGFKYFPIFEPRRRLPQDFKDIDKSLAVKNIQKKKFLMKRGDSSQLVIDAGQKKFGHVFCKECGTLYEIGNPEDEEYHQSVHLKIYSSLKYNMWKNEKQVTNLDEMGGRILKVASEDNALWWRKIEDVLKVVDEELGFSESSVRCINNSLAYMYILDKQIVGIVIAESIEKAYRVIQIESTPVDKTDNKESNSKLICCSNAPSKVVFGISRIWVLGSYRGKGIATKLVDAMRANSISWYYLKVDDFAFSDPTPDGMDFAQKYTKQCDFLVYRRE